MPQTHKEKTQIGNASVVIDGEPIKASGQALLARKKQQPRPIPDDCSGAEEELTHLFVGDRAACVAAAARIAGESEGRLFGPGCGRSGRAVQLITCGPE